MSKLELLHIAAEKRSERAWIEPFCEQLRQLGNLTIVEDGDKMSEDRLADRIRQAEVLILSWDAASIPVSIAAEPGKLRYVCNVTGSLGGMVPVEIIDAGIPVTNWGDAQAMPIAEGAVTLLLACLKDLPGRQRIIRKGGWQIPDDFCTGSLEDLNVGIYGCGVIARRFVEMIRPFGPVMRVFDPYAPEIPDDCIRVDSLEELFAASEAVAIHAGLSDETRGTVTGELLAMLPDDGIVINTARGGIIDQQALFAELESGRLRAGLDVLEQPDRLPPEHPSRHWPNVILSAHCIGAARPLDGSAGEKLIRMHHICLENLRRYIDGEPLKFVMDRDRYLRST